MRVEANPAGVAERVSPLGRLLSLGRRIVGADDLEERLGFDAARTFERIRELDSYLGKAVLNGGRFVCRHARECRASCAGELREGQLHHVGPYYDLTLDGRHLRIAIVGQERAGEPARVSRAERYQMIMSSALEKRFAADGEHGARDSHMKGTTSALRLLFGQGLGADHASEFIYFPDGEACHLFDACALTNLVLCSAHSEGGGSAGRSTATMRENCSAHFRRTMEILEPTVIIVQGKDAGRWVLSAFDEVESLGGPLKRVTLGENAALLAVFTHPAARHPHNWGASERTPYLRQTVKPAIERMRRAILVGDALTAENAEGAERQGHR